MEIYLDNAAGTALCKEAADTMNDVLINAYGNPSSPHGAGRTAEKRLREAREAVAKCINVPEEEVIFTSGGTESNGLAIFGSVKRLGLRAVTSKAEHPSVLDNFRVLAERGTDVVYLKPKTDGSIDYDELSNAINDRTALVSLSHVNHETGAIADLQALSKIIKEKNPKTVFHADAVQSFGKHNVDTHGVDLVSVSAHKAHGPKGVGALYVRGIGRGWLAPLYFGGGQEHGLRNGTENLPGICGFGAAAAACSNEDINIIKMLRDKIADGITCLGGLINSPVSGSPYIINASFIGLPSEVLLNALDALGIYVSAGAACNSKKKASENVAAAYGLGTERASSAIRVSLSRMNTEQEAETFIESLNQILPSVWRKKD